MGKKYEKSCWDCYNNYWYICRYDKNNPNCYFKSRKELSDRVDKIIKNNNLNEK